MLGKHFTCWINVLADDILKSFHNLPKKTRFDISSKLSSPKKTICMKCESLFLREKIRKTVVVCHLPRVV